MQHRRLGARAAACVVGLVAVGAVAPATASTTHQAATARIALRNSTPSWARSGAIGRPSATASASVRVYLAPRGGQAALDATLAAVSTPGNAAYRHFLSVAQYRAQFEPTAGAVSAVGTWLKGAGMRVRDVEASHRYVSATGTVAAAEKAFGTTLNLYRHGGSVVRAPAGNVSVPASVSSLVLGETGLDTAKILMKPSLEPPPPGFNNGRPCSQFYGQIKAKTEGDYTTPLPRFNGRYQDYAVCGYTPDQFRSAYGMDSTNLTGAGVGIGIVDAYASSTMPKDANTYARRRGDAPFASGQYTQTLLQPFRAKNLCGNWSDEQTLDIEASHGIAPDASVHYYGARSCLNVDLYAAIGRAADDDQVAVISDSWGGPESQETAGDIAALEQVVKQAEVEGISVLFSSGDSGDFLAATGTLQAGYPDSDPYATAVGGTSTAIGPDGSLEWQTGWGTHKWILSSNSQSWQPLGFLYGAGGGFSTLFDRPAYQNGVVTSSKPGRATPDMALDADPTTGMLIGQTQAFPSGNHYGEYRLGGTSLASPMFAGMVALAAQSAGSGLGFLNPAIYDQARSGAGTFDDVTSVQQGQGNVRPDYANGVNPHAGVIYSVRTFDQDSSLRTTPGWDDVTGVGTPNAGFLTAFNPS